MLSKHLSKHWSLLGVITISLIWVLFFILTNLPFNFAALTLLHADQNPNSSSIKQIELILSKNISNPCSADWLIFRFSSDENQTAALHYLLSCSADYLPMIAIVRPLDSSLAEEATRLYPQNPQAWFWLAESYFPSNKKLALPAYRQVTALVPSNGLAWCQIGWIQESLNLPAEALTAFYNCCTYEDPGVNGCYGAGRMEEELGNPQAAIVAYYRSRWQGALKRADELQRSFVGK